jgi:uncharacterized protein (DUF433 family)
MAQLDWSQCPAVESIPGKVSGAWVFRNTRMPVSIVFENLEAGATIDEIVEWFDVTPEQVKAVIEFAARSLARVGTFDRESENQLHERRRCVQARTGPRRNTSIAGPSGANE